MSDPDRRGVFISWSKSAAGEVARILRPFLEDVLGTATIFLSQEIEGGDRWSAEISRWLDSCNAGLLIITQQNTHEPWLHFEAGALSKHVETSRVIPLLCGASVGDIQGTPLTQFQTKNFDHDDFLSICLSFGRAFQVEEEAVRRRFEKSWPDVEAAVERVNQGGEEKPKKIGFHDVMAVMERIQNQVSAIERTVTLPAQIMAAAKVRTGMFGTKQNYLGALNEATLGELLLATKASEQATWNKDLLLEALKAGNYVAGPEVATAKGGEPVPVSGYWRTKGTEEQWFEFGDILPDTGSRWIFVRPGPKD